MNPKEGLGMTLPLGLLQGPLVVQKGRALHEKHREGAQPRIDQGVARVLSPMGVGELRKGVAELGRDIA